MKTLPNLKLLTALLGLIAAGSIPSAQAAALTWTNTDNATWDTGWTGGTIPGLSDDLTILGPTNVAGALNIDVAAAAYANTINFTDTSAVGLLNTNSGADKTLTLQGGLTSGTGAVTIGSTTANQGVLVALGASQTWNIGNGGLTANNIISGSGFGITKTGNGRLTLAAANTYSGATEINAGSLTLSGSGSLASSALTFGSKGSTATSMVLTVTPTAAGTTTRSAGLTWNGGIFASANNQNNFIVNGTAAGNTIENFGVLTLNSGMLRGSIVANAAANTRVVFDSITRSAGTALNLNRSATAIGANSIASQTANSANIVFTTAPTLVGNGGASGTTELSILPYANMAIGAPVTYDSVNGLRALNTSTEMVTLVSGLSLGAGSAGQNAKTAAATTISTNTTINSLYGGTSGTISFNSDSTKLTVTSGFIGLNLTYTIGSGTAGGNGILDFGSAEGMMFVENSRVLTLNSLITGSGGLTFVFDNVNTSTAKAVLNNSNTFTGTTSVLGNRAGDMSIKLVDSLALQNSTLDYNNYGGSITFGDGGTTGKTAYTFGGLKGAQNINLNNNNTSVGVVALTVGGNNESTTYSGVLSDTVDGGSLIKTGTGTLTLSGANNYTGGTTINDGTLELGNAAAVSTSAGAITFGGGTLRYGSGITTDYSARIAAGTSASAMKIDTGASNSITFATALTSSQSGGLIKSGAGTLTLGNTANAFTGGITIADGTLAASGSGGTSAVGGANAIQLGDSGNNSVTLQLNNWNNLVASNTVNVVGSGTHTIIGAHNNTGQVHIAGGTITLNNNDLTIRNTSLAGWRIGGGVTGVGNLQFENNNTGGTGNDISIRSALNNTGSVINAGTGNYNLTISGANGGSISTNVTSIVQDSATSSFDLNAVISSFNSATVEVRQGSMLLNNNTALHVANTVSVGSGGTLDVRQNNTIAGLNNYSGNGGTVLNNSASDTTLTVGGSGSYSFGGVLADGTNGGKLLLTKSGAGTQTLTGNSIYTGATTVSGGALIINGDNSAATGAVGVASGATLGGSGMIGGATTISNGATLAPGNSPGLLTFTNSLTLAGTVVMELNGLGRGTTYDAINVGGLLTYGGALTLNFGSTFSNGNSFNLFDFGSQTASFASIDFTGSYVGSLTNNSGTWSGTFGGQDFSFLESTGDLNLVPEPSTYALLGLAGFGAVMLRLRRRIRG